MVRLREKWAAKLGIGVIAFALCGTSCAPSVPRAGRDPGPYARGGYPGAVPQWLPPYTPGQLALLTPVTNPIQVPAPRVFPDLERFGYAPNRKMDDPVESMKFTKLVATVLHDSPRFYALDKTGPEHANTIAQYGPPGTPEADGWAVTSRGDGGISRLARVDPSADARADYDKASARSAQKDASGAAALFRQAVAKSPRIPALRVSLADALAAAGDAAAAQQAYREAIEVDPTYSSAHRGLAEMLIKGGDPQGARREIAEALAYHPGSRRAIEVADAITFGAATEGGGRVRPFPIFIDVDSVGAIHVAAAENNPAQMYASCRAVMRYEPDVRAALFKQPAETPYFLSVAEEVICVESAIGAYLFERSSEDSVDDDADPAMETLLKMAQKDGLSGYAMFEILGQHRPERARMAPPEVHRAMVEYVQEYVLGNGAGSLPAGTYTAALRSARDTLARR